MTNATTKNGSNGVHPDAAITPEHDLLWDSLSPKVVSELEKPLDPSLVSQCKGRAGRTYQYIEGHTVIRTSGSSTRATTPTGARFS